MALEIRPTPTLAGDDAIKFLEKIADSQDKKVNPDKSARARKFAKKILQKSKK